MKTNYFGANSGNAQEELLLNAYRAGARRALELAAEKIDWRDSYIANMLREFSKNRDFLMQENPPKEENDR